MKERKKVPRTLVNWHYHVGVFQIDLAHVVSFFQRFPQHWNYLHFEVSILNLLIQIGAIQNWASLVRFLNRKKLWEIIFGLGRRYFDYSRVHRLRHSLIHCCLFYFDKFHWSITPRTRCLVPLKLVSIGYHWSRLLVKNMFSPLLWKSLKTFPW